MQRRLGDQGMVLERQKMLEHSLVVIATFVHLVRVLEPDFRNGDGDVGQLEHLGNLDEDFAGVVADVVVRVIRRRAGQGDIDLVDDHLGRQMPLPGIHPVVVHFHVRLVWPRPVVDVHPFRHDEHEVLDALAAEAIVHGQRVRAVGRGLCSFLSHSSSRCRIASGRERRGSSNCQ